MILGTNFSRPRSFDFSICSCFKNIIENNRLPSGLFSFFQRRVTGWKGLKESSTEGLKSLSGGLGGGASSCPISPNLLFGRGGEEGGANH